MSKDTTNKASIVADYVIVGAGPSAMGLLYGLLSPYRSDEPPFSVAVVERGSGPPHSATISNPSLWARASFADPQSAEVVHTKCRGRRIDWPLGKGLGGSSNVNACLSVPPNHDDFALWSDPWKTEIMSSVHCIQDVITENNALQYTEFIPSSEYSFDGGMIPADTLATSRPWRESKFPSLITTVPTTTRVDSQGRTVRVNMHEALVQPLLDDHPKLKSAVQFFKGVEVQRILFENNQAKGVECLDLGSEKLFEIHARGMVVLCAGSLETPALLMTSGIGPKDELLMAAIPSVADIGNVGKNLRDHFILPRLVMHPWTYFAMAPTGVQAMGQVEMEGPNVKGKKRFNLMLGDLSTFPDFICQEIQLKRTSGRPTTMGRILSVAESVARFLLRVMFAYSPLYLCFRYIARGASVCLLNPVSTGQVTIERLSQGTPVRRRDVDIKAEAPYLTDNEDLEAIKLGLDASTEFANSWFSRGWFEVSPDWSKYKSKDAPWFAAFVRKTVMPYYHYCGTCAMQTSDCGDNWVVDSQLRVRDVHSLRVCDASVFPSCVSCPTTLTCTAMGFLFGKQLLKDEAAK